MRTSQEYKELSLREFTKAAESYETEHAGIYKTCREDYVPLLDEIAKEPFADLLDAGCGTGPVLSLLSEDYPQAHLVGLDLAPKMIEVAREKALPNVELVVGDCENLPFEDASFDVVICCESFHHYPNPQDFFNSVARVLRPGGRLILFDYSAEGALLWLVNHIEMPLCNAAGHGDVATYSKSEYEAFGKAAGLSMEHCHSGKLYKVRITYRK